MSKHLYIPVAGVTADQLPSNHHGQPRSGGRSHKGIDIFADEGTPVVAARGGTVVKVGESGLGGLRVWVKDDDGNFHYYAHLSSINVEAGQRVAGGEMLGGVGDTGNAKGTRHHLHYSVNPNSSSSEQGSFDAYTYLTGGSSVQVSDSFTAAAERRRRSDAGLPELGPLPEPKLTRFEKQRKGQELLRTAMTSMSQVVQRDPERQQMFDVKDLLAGPVLGRRTTTPLAPAAAREEN